tara:strand:- start:54920 stop:55249 length:330 start_codon:yes stop_codon:yes gene_type:complete
MSKKNLSNPNSIASIIPTILKPIKKKFSTKFLELSCNWENIFEKDFTRKCSPLKCYKLNDKNILEITVVSIYALEYSFRLEEIKKKINCFFKADYIDNIKIKKIYVNNI